MTDTAAPVRIERDGDVAVVVLDNPPLNLFTPAVFNALDERGRRTGRADRPVRRPAGPARCCSRRAARSSPPGSTSTFFRDIAEGPEPIRRGGELWTQLLRVQQTFEDLPVPTVFAAHGLCPDGGVRAGAGLRHPAGRREGVVRPRRDRRRADPVDGRAAAAGRAGGSGPGEGAHLHRRALQGRRPGAVERGQPGAAGRGLRRGRPRVRAPGRRRARRSPTRRPSGWSPPRCATVPGRPTRSCPRSPVRCSPPRTSAGRWRPSSTDGPGKATYSGR